MSNLITKFIKLFTIAIIISNFQAFGQDRGRVIGCVPNWISESVLDSVDFSGLTHVVYSFIVPYSDGSVFIDLNEPLMEKMVQKAAENDVKVMLAFAGGAGPTFDPDTVMTKMVDDSAALSKFISHLMNIVRKYDLAGLSNDWEPFNNPASKADKFEYLMEVLSDSLAPYNKILTSDIIAGAWASGYITPRTIELSHYMNIMTYYYSPNSVSDMDNAMQYWLNTKGVPKGKLNFVIGFFGTPHNEWSTTYTYQDIIGYDSTAFKKDSITIGSKVIWYNGLNNCEKIVDLAWQKYGGVAMWHVGLDKFDDRSLLKTVVARTKANKDGDVNIDFLNNRNWSAGNSLLNVVKGKIICVKDVKELKIFNSKGVLLHSFNNLKQSQNINIENLLSSGVYLIDITESGKKSSFKIIQNH